MFKRVDVKKDKLIDFQEFQNALHVVGIYVDKAIEKQCFEEMDKDMSGTLDMDEFIVALRVGAHCLGGHDFAVAMPVGTIYLG